MVAHGKPRDFGVGLLLVIVTLSFYARVWSWKVVKDVSLQSGIQLSAGTYRVALGLTIATLFLGGLTAGILGIAGAVFLLIYFFRSIGALNRARAIAGLDRGVAPPTFVGMVAVGQTIAFVAWMLLLAPSGIGLESNTPLTAAQAERLLSEAGKYSSSSSSAQRSRSSPITSGRHPSTSVGCASTN